MVFFLYKCYYVLFLHFSKDESATPWWSALLGLTVSFTILFISILHLFGLLDMTIPGTVGDGPLARRGKYLWAVLPYFLIIWFILKYFIFGLAKVSKIDGHSQRFSFTPSNRDKIICWLTCLMSFGSIGVVAVIKKLLN